MSTPGHRHEPAPAPAGGRDRGQEGHGHSGWLMVACCIPMVLAIVLIVFGR